MKNIDEYRLELEKYANNLDNKRQDYSHNINEDYASDKHIVSLLSAILLEENNIFDAMGDYDLINYEKWLEDDRF